MYVLCVHYNNQSAFVYHTAQSCMHQSEQRRMHSLVFWWWLTIATHFLQSTVWLEKTVFVRFLALKNYSHIKLSNFSLKTSLQGQLWVVRCDSALPSKLSRNTRPINLFLIQIWLWENKNQENDKNVFIFLLLGFKNRE